MPATLAYIHTSPVLIPLFTELSKQELPGVTCFHMVDESLIRNTIAAGALTKTTTRRVISMVGSAREGGADAVMVTCSSIGQATTIASGVYDFPVIRVDEAMAEEAVSRAESVGVAATVRTTLEPTVGLLRDKAAAAGRNVEIVESLCDGAFEAVLAGDMETHDRKVSETLADLARRVELIVLAQASMVRVVASLPDISSQVPILSSPILAIRRVRGILARADGGAI